MILGLTLETFIVIAILAFIAECIDSSLGMGYGTLLSPLLLIIGFSPLLAVPSILITQALGGFSASISHHKYGNAYFNIKSKNPIYILKKIREHGIKESFHRGFSEDLKTVIFITSLGIVATIIAALVAVTVSKTVINTYIGILVLLMGILIFSGIKFQYSIKKMFLIGVISSFNKGFSGGGFGPVVTGGQMVIGQDHKKAIGCTTAAEAPICVVGFLAYLLTNNLSNWGLVFALGSGAIFAGFIGPRITSRINKKNLLIIVSLVMITLGALTLAKTYGILALKVSV